MGNRPMKKKATVTYKAGLKQIFLVEFPPIHSFHGPTNTCNIERLKKISNATVLLLLSPCQAIFSYYKSQKSQAHRSFRNSFFHEYLKNCISPDFVCCPVIALQLVYHNYTHLINIHWLICRLQCDIMQWSLLGFQFMLFTSMYFHQFFLLFCKQFSYYIHQRQRHVFALLFVDTMMSFEVNFLPSFLSVLLLIHHNYIQQH